MQSKTREQRVACLPGAGKPRLGTGKVAWTTRLALIPYQRHKLSPLPRCDLLDGRTGCSGGPSSRLEPAAGLANARYEMYICRNDASCVPRLCKKHARLAWRESRETRLSLFQAGPGLIVHEKRESATKDSGDRPVRHTTFNQFEARCENCECVSPGRRLAAPHFWRVAQ